MRISPPVLVPSFARMGDSGLSGDHSGTPIGAHAGSNERPERSAGVAIDAAPSRHGPFWIDLTSRGEASGGPYSAATRCAATPRAFTTTLIASSTRSLA